MSERVLTLLLAFVGNAALIGWREPRRVLFQVLLEPQYRSEGGGWLLGWLRDLLLRPHGRGPKAELRGRVLGCFCAPLPCHADVLAEVANAD